jgi:tRNA threonylcarbamoyladenosine modification (KEOPS) complex  Pcc1 subunit
VNPPRWSATFTVRLDSPDAAERLLRSLGPEAAREVPKTTAVVARPSPTVVTIDVRASDAGALRAAANTYLGWVDLAGASEIVARAAERGNGPASPKPLSR